MLYELQSAIADGSKSQHIIGFSQTLIKISIVPFGFSKN
jgi:hypothetical protein